MGALLLRILLSPLLLRRVAAPTRWQALASGHGLDASRVMLLGASAGGFMANRMACDAPELFAGKIPKPPKPYKLPAASTSIQTLAPGP